MALSFDKPSSGADNDPAWRRETRPFPGAPSDRERVPPPSETFSMDELREIHARSKNNAELEAPWKAEQAQQEQRERSVRRPDADKPAPTDKSAERIAELETELAATKSELAEERTDRRKLTSVVADQAEEIKRLRAQLEAKATEPDQPVASAGAVDSSPKTIGREDKPLSEPDRPWYKKVPLPSEKSAALFTGAAGLVESVGVATHGMSGTAESITTAAIGFGVASIGFAREKRKEQAEKEKNKNG